MEDLIEMAKTRYNIMITCKHDNWYRIKSKYFSESCIIDHGCESLNNKIQNTCLKDNFYEMMKEKSIYCVEILGNVIYLHDISLSFYPGNGNMRVIKKTSRPKTLLLKNTIL
jgi:hypothetical protein